MSALARARGVTSGGGAPIRFVSPENQLHGALEQQYEMRIYRDGEVPSRTHSVHDLFNALAWLAFPTTKAMLNRKHNQGMAARRNQESHGKARRDEGSRGTARRGDGSRGTARDVLTLFDESGVIVACGEPVLESLLREFEWKALFWTRRAAVMRAMRFFLFGHALHEKVLRPYKGITARALVLGVDHEFLDMPLESQLAQIDARAAQYFARPYALDSTQTLAPVPILGVPGWETANESEKFYDDTSVFRPGRVGHRS